MVGGVRATILSSSLSGFAASFCACMKMQFFMRAVDFSVRVSAKKKTATLEHHPGQFRCSNVAIIYDSIMGRIEYPP
jgi:hypothetical protein